MKDKFLDATKMALPVVVVISAVYEYFYFKGLGVDLERSPLGTADFLRGWLVWSPILIPFILGNLFSQVLVIGAGGSYAKSDTATTSRTLSPASVRLANRVYWGLSACGVLILGYCLFVGEKLQLGVQSCVPAFTVALIAKIPTLGLSPDREKSTLTYLLVFAFVAYFSLYGFAQGTAVLDEEFEVANIDSRQVTKVDGISYDVVRVFDQWTLARQRPKHYIWIHNQSEHSIEFKAGRKRYQGLRCIWNEDSCYINKRERESFQ